MPIPPQLPGFHPLTPTGFAPRPHANLRYAVPDRKYFILPYPPLTKTFSGACTTQRSGELAPEMPKEAPESHKRAPKN